MQSQPQNAQQTHTPAGGYRDLLHVRTVRELCMYQSLSSALCCISCASSSTRRLWPLYLHNTQYRNCMSVNVAYRMLQCSLCGDDDCKYCSRLLLNGDITWQRDRMPHCLLDLQRAWDMLSNNANAILLTPPSIDYSIGLVTFTLTFESHCGSFVSNRHQHGNLCVLRSSQPHTLSGMGNA